jgi:hypothetical protein
MARDAGAGTQAAAIVMARAAGKSPFRRDTTVVRNCTSSLGSDVDATYPPISLHWMRI